jgi:hypothetical protein
MRMVLLQSGIYRQVNLLRDRIFLSWTLFPYLSNWAEALAREQAASALIF